MRRASAVWSLRLRPCWTRLTVRDRSRRPRPIRH
jgi:hypothetical protein